MQTPSGAALGTPLVVPLMCAISPLSSMGVKTCKNRSGTWPTALPSLGFTIIVSGLGRIIHGVIVFAGSF